MLLKQKTTGHIVEVLDLNDLANPYCQSIVGRMHWGEEPADPEAFEKRTLCFVSGESLPQCWSDEHYRDHELIKRMAGNLRKSLAH